MTNFQEFFLEDIFKFTDYLKEDCLRKNLNTSSICPLLNKNIINFKTFFRPKRSNSCETLGNLVHRSTQKTILRVKYDS